MTRVLWIDPGLKTGAALFDSQTGVHQLWIIDGGQKGFQEWWERSGHKLEYDVFGYESFELEEGTHGVDVNDPNEVIGYIKSLGRPVISQRRMERGKSDLISDAVLKRAGLYPPRGQVKEKHHVEALRHALRYLVRQRDMQTIELLHPKDS